MKILITGSRGFVGGSLGYYAATRGHKVLGVARSSQPTAGWPGQHVSADISQSDLSEVIDRFSPDMVFHGAGASSVKSSLESPVDDFRAAVMTWTNVLDGIRRSNGRPLIIFPSSAAVYGNPSTLPVTETDAIAPISPYGFHKSICETVGKEFAQCFGLNIVIARIFSLFGAAQRRLLVWELFQQMQGSEDVVWLQGKGNESRDYLHIDEFCKVILAIGEHNPKLHDGEGGFAVFNVASGTETCVLDLADKLRTLVSQNKKVDCRGNAMSGDPQRWCADVRLLQNLIRDWSPSSLETGLSQCVDTWRGEAKTS